MTDDTNEIRDDTNEIRVVHRTFDPADCSPEFDVVEAVADLENTEPDELPPLYTRIDNVIRNIFSEPPEPEAQVQVVFNYAGYRITIAQDGSAEFIKVA